ncbi:hypothetical protein AX17_005157 [Amanita inopinata Kibby_2008]|nr:hypothetical protein AX17_005157 [Amanita inopinata Kibby_2008]
MSSEPMDVDSGWHQVEKTGNGATMEEEARGERRASKDYGLGPLSLDDERCDGPTNKHNPYDGLEPEGLADGPRTDEVDSDSNNPQASQTPQTPVENSRVVPQPPDKKRYPTEARPRPAESYRPQATQRTADHDSKWNRQQETNQYNPRNEGKRQEWQRSYKAWDGHNAQAQNTSQSSYARQPAWRNTQVPDNSETSKAYDSPKAGRGYENRKERKESGKREKEKPDPHTNERGHKTKDDNKSYRGTWNALHSPGSSSSPRTHSRVPTERDPVSQPKAASPDVKSKYLQNAEETKEMQLQTLKRKVSFQDPQDVHPRNLDTTKTQNHDAQGHRAHKTVQDYRLDQQAQNSDAIQSDNPFSYDATKINSLEVEQLKHQLMQQELIVKRLKERCAASEVDIVMFTSRTRDYKQAIGVLQSRNDDSEATIAKLASRLSEVENSAEVTRKSHPKRQMDAAIQTTPKRDTWCEPANSPLLPLLATLRNRRAAPINTLVNAATIDLVVEFLELKNYINLGLQVTAVEDIENLIEFLTHLLHNNLLKDIGPDANRKARRIMLKLLAKTAITPKSLYLSNVTMESFETFASGGFANVFVGDYNGSRVALKWLRNVQRNVDFCREALIWRSLSHEYVLPFFGIHEDKPRSFISLVAPFMDNGTLNEWRKNQNPSVADIRKHIQEVAEGVRYLHSEGVIHGDLRGNNILLDSKLRVQIADFGLTRHSDATATKTLAFSPSFAAPELLSMFDELDDDDMDDHTETVLRTEKTDVFAFGSLYYEIHFGAAPFEGMSDMKIIGQVRNKKRASRLQSPPIGDEGWKLISRCWRPDPARRPTMEDVVEIMTAW